MYHTLVSAAELLPIAGQVRLLDCSFDLADTAAGERAHAAAHLPGALYLHLDRDLSGPRQDAAGRFRGRHPLPERAVLADTLGRAGIAPGLQVVAYDAQGGPYAARAWWLLRWLGHEAVAVLDGGPAAWQAAGGALSAEPTRIAPLPPYPVADAPGMPVIEVDELLSGLARLRVVDARAPERFRGESETLDAAAGHIPGALNRFFKLNLRADGRFKAASELRAEWAPLRAAGDGVLVQQCGSGVTACHNLLALAHAGLGDSTLYPGSWSEWSADPSRPVARG